MHTAYGTAGLHRLDRATQERRRRPRDDGSPSADSNERAGRYGPARCRPPTPRPRGLASTIAPGRCRLFSQLGQRRLHARPARVGPGHLQRPSRPRDDRSSSADCGGRDGSIIILTRARQPSPSPCPSRIFLPGTTFRVGSPSAERESVRCLASSLVDLTLHPPARHTSPRDTRQCQCLFFLGSLGN